MADEHRLSSSLNIVDVEDIDSGEAYRKRIKRAKYIISTVLVLSFIVFVVIAAAAVLNAGIDKIVGTLETINLWYLLAAFAVIFVSYVFRFPKWEQYMKRLNVHIPRTKNFLIYMSMYSMDITPGRWGRAVVSYTINRITGIRFANTFPAVVADIFTDFLGFAFLAVFMAFFVGRFQVLSVIITAILLIPFVFIYTKRLFKFFKRKMHRIRLFKSLFKHGEVYFKYNKLLDRGVYAYSMLYTIPSMFINGFALYLVILSFGISLDPAFIPAVLFIYSSSLMLGLITGLPATMGVTDAALIGYLVLFFPTLITFATASLITIFFRIASVWFVEGFGFAALAHTMKYWNVKSAVER